MAETPPVRRRLLGAALRRYRESLGYRLDDAARINFSGGTPTTPRLRALGFTVTSVSADVGVSASTEGFRRADYEVLGRYPKGTRWNEHNVGPRDHALFRDIRGRLSRLADMFAEYARVSSRQLAESLFRFRRKDKFALYQQCRYRRWAGYLRE